MENQYKKRIRINVTTSIKGIKTWEATVEMIDTEQAEVLTESDKLVAELNQRYPAQIETKEGVSK